MTLILLYYLVQMQPVFEELSDEQNQLVSGCLKDNHTPGC